MAAEMYYFNPESDMALAHFVPYYKAPSEIVRMADDLSVLPAWYAPEGSVIKVDSLGRSAELSAMYAELGFVFPVGWSEEWKSMPLRPWGWSPSLLYLLKNQGVDEDYLPSGDRMRRIRSLSGRQQAAELLKRLSDIPLTCGRAEACVTLDGAKDFVFRAGKAVLKSPWSGSGRGVMLVSPDVWTDALERRVARILRTQGEIMAEPFYDKVCDFALEFYSDGKGGVSFAGYSWFETDRLGNYKSNKLLSDERIEQELRQYVPLELLRAVRQRLCSELPVLIGTGYAGYLGVDMMVCREEGRMKLHPCVEINLRMNMGIVSRLLFDRHVCPQSEGQFLIEHYFADGEAWENHSRMKERFPAQVIEGRLSKGYFPLTPVRKDTRYQAYLLL